MAKTAEEYALLIEEALDKIDEALDKGEFMVVEINLREDDEWHEGETLAVKISEFRDLFNLTLDVGEGIERDISDDENPNRQVCYTRIR